MVTTRQVRQAPRPLGQVGLSFDWNQLYGDSKPRRISLPTYPFARERYWVPVDKNKSTSNGTAKQAIATSVHPKNEQKIILVKDWNQNLWK